MICNTIRKIIILNIILLLIFLLFTSTTIIGNESHYDFFSRDLSFENINYKIYCHKPTQNEIENMKNKIGVYNPFINYNIKYNDHGTGLAPPTKDEWNNMGNVLRIVDNILFYDNNPKLSSIDHSTSPHFPTVGDQGPQGSCAAWAIAYYQNGYYQAIDKGWTETSTGNTAQLMSPAWTYNKANPGWDHGSSFSGNWEVISSVGNAKESTMPYDPYDCVSWGFEEAWRSAPEFRCNNSIFSNRLDGIETIKNALIAGYVPVIAIDADMYYTGLGFNDDTITSNEVLFNPNHANTIVGYDDDKTADGEVGAFKIVNSWGSSWGWSWGGYGYYWMTYDAFIELGNFYHYAYFFDDYIYYQPSHLGVWELDPQCDRDAEIELGIGSKDDPMDIRYPLWDGHTAVMHPYPDFMCLDVSEFYDENEMGESNIYLEIGDADENDGMITNFWIEYYDYYISGFPDKESIPSPELPKVTPCYINASFTLKSVYNINKEIFYILIQDSIIDADPGDTVEVWSNEYHENPIIMVNGTMYVTGEENNPVFISSTNGTRGIKIYNGTMKLQNGGGINIH